MGNRYDVRRCMWKRDYKCVCKKVFEYEGYEVMVWYDTLIVNDRNNCIIIERNRSYARYSWEEVERILRRNYELEDEFIDLICNLFDYVELLGEDG